MDHDQSAHGGLATAGPDAPDHLGPRLDPDSFGDNEARGDLRADPGSARPIDRLLELVQGIEQESRLDPAIDALESAIGPVLGTPEARRVLGGEWLGHAAHPLLTDVPIGSWTSAWLLDIFGGKRSAPYATGLVASGVLAAVPTALTGASDWLTLDRPSQRVGVVHLVANSAALAAYSLSLVARLRGRRASGVAWGMVGAAAATTGGYLGGHLVLARGAGVEPPSEISPSR